MPATPFNTTAANIAALLIHSITPVDSDVGTRYAMTGLLLNNAIEVKPSRERNVKKDHRGTEVMSLATNPMIVLSFDADVTALDGPFSAKHPGTAIDISTVQNYYTGLAHGFPTGSSGWFELMEPSFTSPPGDLFKTKFNLRLWSPSYLDGGVYVYGPS